MTIAVYLRWSIGAILSLSLATNPPIASADTPASTVEKVRIQIMEICWFTPASDRLERPCLAWLDTVAAVMQENPRVRKISVDGHAFGTVDSNGPMDRFNTSMHRARAVRSALVERGVDSSRLSMAAFGSDKPISPGKNAPEAARNRRVELRVLEIAAD